MNFSLTLLPAALALAGIALTACGDSSDSATSGQTEAAAVPDERTVIIERSRFQPTELTVAADTTVEFDNRDAYAHTVTSSDDPDGEFDSGDMPGETTYSFTFEDPGEYAYFCEIHPTMRATIIVE